MTAAALVVLAVLVASIGVAIHRAMSEDER